MLPSDTRAGTESLGIQKDSQERTTSMMVGMYIWRKAYPRRRLNQKRATSLEWVPKGVRTITNYAECVWFFIYKVFLNLFTVAVMRVKTFRFFYTFSWDKKDQWSLTHRLHNPAELSLISLCCLRRELKLSDVLKSCSCQKKITHLWPTVCISLNIFDGFGVCESKFCQMFILDIYMVITFEPCVVQFVSCIRVWGWMYVRNQNTVT